MTIVIVDYRLPHSQTSLLRPPYGALNPDYLYDDDDKMYAKVFAISSRPHSVSRIYTRERVRVLSFSFYNLLLRLLLVLTRRRTWARWCHPTFLSQKLKVCERHFPKSQEPSHLLRLLLFTLKWRFKFPIQNFNWNFLTYFFSFHNFLDVADARAQTAGNAGARNKVK